MFDAQSYIQTLGWLGRPIHTSRASVVLRRFGSAHWDVRGSWPYQSLPSAEGLASMRELTDAPPLTFAAVIRPDLDPQFVETKLDVLRRQFRLEFRRLKPHLGHRHDLPSAREQYSRRTLRRLERADAIFTVQRESLRPDHLVMSSWQSRLKSLRSIQPSSSPDWHHFAGLIATASSSPERIACITLRQRETGMLAGVFLLFAARDSGSWHAHSFLVDERSLADFGTYLLFDRAIELLGTHHDIWFGGAPFSPNGSGVFTFKNRFANCSAHAHMICVDLDDGELARLRASHGPFPWLPDYRAPEAS